MQWVLSIEPPNTMEEVFYTTNWVMSHDCVFHKVGEQSPGTGDVKDISYGQKIIYYSLNFPCMIGLRMRARPVVFQAYSCPKWDGGFPTWIRGFVVCRENSLSHDHPWHKLSLKTHVAKSYGVCCHLYSLSSLDPIHKCQLSVQVNSLGWLPVILHFWGFHLTILLLPFHAYVQSLKMSRSSCMS